MKDYTDIGLSSHLVKAESPAGRDRKWQTDFEQDASVEKGPYAKPTEIQKGTTNITYGGIINFQDASGSTILTYLPSTGAITITSNVNVSGVFNEVGTVAVTGA